MPRQQMVLDTHFLFILFTFLQRIILFAPNKVAKLGWFVVVASSLQKDALKGRKRTFLWGINS